MKTAFITGATSGIGKATAILLGKSGYRIIACGRRQDRLDELKGELAAFTEVYTLSFDVREKDAVFKAIDSLPNDWRNIDLLVNNAGNAHGLASIQNGSIDDWDAMIDINVKGLLYVSKAIIPNMIERNTGHIINIGSIAGREVYPNGNVYCASKYAVDAINNGMRIDLNEYNIRVSQIAPGLVETEFSLIRFKGDADKSAGVYEGYDALKPEDLADLILFMATRPAHVNLADVLILPTAQANATTVKKH
ncbi:SDR family NAD(P)-dependent oxidoreductase [Owenweeksia hongkongensis]|uniref:Short-chain alcohol dehydrogenase n=1 Tax=Owenweeksia hongkongensis (strain DSM 17368 / CIP 108786 / JCM 12287 / NRRL B-23963 / UST20020801) TaxID=926562 RepID=G8R0H4_OWEHD|nr:SDR family NAD(P)-dependent oxidoreductase [Owenweeksia hongkongensis]AEV32678.1 short-chain alcohol dehydrogenase [Owenweeksia hongkongensis DSM 17368]